MRRDIARLQSRVILTAQDSGIEELAVRLCTMHPLGLEPRVEAMPGHLGITLSWRDVQPVAIARDREHNYRLEVFSGPSWWWATGPAQTTLLQLLDTAHREGRLFYAKNPA